MSITSVRDSFNAVALPKLRCVAARLSYCARDGNGVVRDHQWLEFDVVQLDNNSARTITSEPIPPHIDPMTAARVVARMAMEELAAVRDVALAAKDQS